MPAQFSLAMDAFSSYFIFINYQEGMFQLRSWLYLFSSFSYYLTQIKEKLLKKSLYMCGERGRKAKYSPAQPPNLWGEGCVSTLTQMDCCRVSAIYSHFVSPSLGRAQAATECITRITLMER